jgi:hypothetical protein
METREPRRMLDGRVMPGMKKQIEKLQKTTPRR